MNLIIKVKYGKNTVDLPLPNGEVVKTEFTAKYGKNKIVFATAPRIEVVFDLKYGETSVDVPISENVIKAFQGKALLDLWRKKVTIYNDISATETENRHFDRFVIEKCNIQGGRVSKADGTIENVVNAKTVWTKDLRYKEPSEYVLLPVDERENYYTVQIGDFVVLDEVEDIVENSKDFAVLQTKYANNGFKVTSISPNIIGMRVDNVSFTNA